MRYTYVSVECIELLSNQMGPWHSFGMMSQCYPCIWNATYRFQRVRRSNHRYIATTWLQNTIRDCQSHKIQVVSALLPKGDTIWNHLQVEVAKLIILFLQNATDCRVETVMDDINGQEQIWSSNSKKCQQAIAVSWKTKYKTQWMLVWKHHNFHVTIILSVMTLW